MNVLERLRKASAKHTAELLPLRVGFAVVIFFLSANSVFLFNSFNSVKHHEDSVDHTYKVISEIDQIFSYLKDAETAIRGYILTENNPSYLEPYDAARFNLRAHLDNLAELTVDNPEQTKNVRTLSIAAEERMSIITSQLQQRHEAGKALPIDIPTMDRGRVAMNQVRDLIATMRAEEMRLLEERRQNSKKAADFADRSLILTLAVSLLLAIIAYRLFRNALVRQAQERWMREGLSAISVSVSGGKSIAEVGRNTLVTLSEFVPVSVAKLSLIQGESLSLIGSYGLDESSLGKVNLSLKQSLAAEAVQQRKILRIDDVPHDYIRVNSSLGDMAPTTILIAPAFYEGQVIGVVEIGTTAKLNSLMQDFITSAMEIVGRSLFGAQSQSRLQELLEETQAQSEELQTQQEELRVTNEELMEQANALSLSQDKLKMQQEELRQTNEQLEDQATTLVKQQNVTEKKAKELELAKADLEQRARELSQASQYKSDFLANMSHELRTPLNSLLILATLLQENPEGNLSEEQVSFAETIRGAGNDLLGLINDILDLSKVEAGKMEIYMEDVQVTDLVGNLERTFRQMAETKGLDFEIHVAPDVPKSILSDQKRLEQILRNFLANAIKFTEKGSVSIEVVRPSEQMTLEREGLNAQNALAFSVVDTGIGIPKEKQRHIFEAFNQADTSTSRKYGGTGLGLTICRELAILLGGELILKSEVAKGSSFTLVLPESANVLNSESSAENREVPPRDHVTIRAADETVKLASEISLPVARIDDDRAFLKPGDKLILIVEDDVKFSKIQADIARSFGFKCLCATDGEQALADVREFKPLAIVLDMKLPGVSGMGLLETLKSDPKTRHIPIHVVSGVDVSHNALRMGAMGYLMKPVGVDQLRSAFQRIEDMISRKLRRVLIVEDDDRQRQVICRLIEGEDVETAAVGLASEAKEKLERETFDCVIMDLRLPDKSGLELLAELSREKGGSRPPVIIYTGKELTRDEVMQLRLYSDTIIIKGVRSPERLVDEVSLFLHRVESELPKEQQEALSELRKATKLFQGQSILLVDDDLRNTFALMSALEPRGLKISVARNGKEALAKIAEGKPIDLVLMDVMMPEMDGYTAMREIRKNPRHAKLPIIALTAKAMRGDQEKCIEAGANDYLPKPIDLERLLSVLRAWLPDSDEFKI